MSANEKYIALIALCEALFVKQRVNGVTIGDIAGSAGISNKTLYSYFSNKEAIVANLFGNFRYHFLIGHLEKNLEKGVIAGYYRSEIDIQNTALIYVTWIIDGYYNRHFSFKVALEGNSIFTNGIVNNSAKALVSSYQTGSNGYGLMKNQ
jgi:hypothetical protein